MRFLLVLSLMVGCGADSTESASSSAGPIEVIYLTGSEAVNVLTCEVSTEAVVEVTQELEIGPAELSALDAACENNVCRLSNNFESKHALCGTQEIYKGVTRRMEYKTFHNPFQ